MTDQKDGVAGPGWCELVTNDAGDAMDFYTRLFGWSAEETSVGENRYLVFKNSQGAVGGILEKPGDEGETPAGPHWNVYFSVPDLDAVVEKAQQLGAETLVPPTVIPGVGRFYAFRDPQGARIAVIRYGEEEPADVKGSEPE
ncbi:MAG: VOC family protein [Desulfatibacillaceae bacterium]